MPSEPAGRRYPACEKLLMRCCDALLIIFLHNSDHRPAPCTSTDERYPHERCMRWYRATDARYLRRSWGHQPQDEKSVLLQVPTSLLDASLPNYVDLLHEQKGLCVVADLGRPREWCNLERGGCIG